jgi:Flp pilus assembly protein TadG
MRRIHAEDGAAAVEFALVVPILILLVFGIIEFGFVFNQWLSVTHAAREGVRTYSLTGDATEGAAAGEASAPDLVGEMTCVGTAPSVTQVEMECTTVHDLELLVFQTDLEITSTATMRKE